MIFSVCRYLNRSSSVENLVENWQSQHNQAMFLFDVEELIRECIDLGALSKHAWQTLHENAFHRATHENIEESGGDEAGDV